MRLGGRAELEQRTLELVDSRSGRARDAEHPHDAIVLDVERRVREQVDLVQHDGLSSLLQTGAVRSQLSVDHAPALGRVVLRCIDHVQQQARALEMREKLVAEPDAFARALDQPGNVRDRQLPPVGRVDRPEHGRERREWILGHLRPRVGDACEQRRLARIGKADEGCVREQLEPQLERRLLPEQPCLREARHLPRR